MCSARSRGRALVLALAVSAGMLLALPAAGAGEPAGPGKPKPCKLLKRGEIKTELGQPTKKPRPGVDAPQLGFCTWKVKAAAELPAGDVMVTHAPFDGRLHYDPQTDQAEPVSDLGDEALYDGALEMVKVLDGDIYVGVQLNFYATDADGYETQVDRRDAAIELARRALDRV